MVPTGSENQRHEQGVCLTPSAPPVGKKPARSRYFIRKGTECAVSRVSPLCWREYTTTRDLGFDRYENHGNGHVTFRESGYLIRLAWDDVSRR
jgi:hypothetical protein